MAFSTRLLGGLGNMMFQIAWGESMSKKYDIDVCYSNLSGQFDLISKMSRSPHAIEYLYIFPNLNWGKNNNILNEYVPKYVPFHYTDIIPKNGFEYIGYFQSEKFFYDRDFIKQLFEPSRSIRQYCIDNREHWGKCFIHVRRTDYLSLADYHPNCDMDYYTKSIGYMKEHGVKEFLVFSDDIEWCKQTFIGNEYTFIKDKDYNELFFMTYCDNAIVSNSSFAWFGAWLGDMDKVIAPKQWLGAASHQDDKDVVPDRWIKI